ncbi:MAG: PilZ domain-containing protein [Bdellovibrio sp.]|nr:PilZ domain-containing protein [Bdellovibrio sp.]
MGKVIDLVPRLKTVASEVNPIFNSAGYNPDKASSEVMSFDEQRQKILFDERREVKRTILTEFVSAMVVLPEKGLLKVAIYDISEEGISFDVEHEYGQFKVDEEVAMRVYLNHKTYFPISVKVKHVIDEKVEGILRHGSVFQKGAGTDAALQYFVRFIESVSQGLKKDVGDIMVPKTS